MSINNSLNNYQTNLHPTLLAATFVEQNRYPINDICIHPDSSPHQGQLNEITTVKAHKRKGTISILVKSQSQERKELIQNPGKKSDYKFLLELMEEKINQVKTEMCLEERKYVLGTAELTTRFFDLPDFLDLKQRKIMAYYLPWRYAIQGDLELTTACFQSALSYEIKIVKTSSQRYNVDGTTVGNWVLNKTDVSGGKTRKTNPCVCIEIGPVSNEALSDLVPGSRKRRFIEEVLFPSFLPEKWDWQTKIRLAEKDSKFISKSHNALTLVGTNSYIN